MKHPRQHSAKHLAFIRSLKCLICGDNTTVEAAHIRQSNRQLAKEQAGIGAKPDDSWTVPLCGAHHRKQHEVGERNFWREYGKNPFLVALALWRASGDHEQGTVIVENN